MKRHKVKSGYTIPEAPGAFTLAEILVVVVIIALIAGAGAGFYAGTYKNMLVKKSARDFLLAAKYARIMAIERQKRCQMKLDSDQNRFVLVIDVFNELTGQTQEVIVQDLYFKPVSFAGDVKFESIKIQSINFEETLDLAESQTIVFSPNGTAQSAIVQIGDGNNHYTVAISAATGKAKMHFGKAEGLKSDTIDLDEL